MFIKHAQCSFDFHVTSRCLQPVQTSKGIANFHAKNKKPNQIRNSIFFVTSF